MPDLVRSRHSIRLRGYDYTAPGGCCVPIMTDGMTCLFGEIVGEEMRLNELGRIGHEEWIRSVQIRKEIRLSENEFVVMPNHTHGIVWIDAAPVRADSIRPEKVVHLEEGLGAARHSGAGRASS